MYEGVTESPKAVGQLQTGRQNDVGSNDRIIEYMEVAPTGLITDGCYFADVSAFDQRPMLASEKSLLRLQTIRNL